jgi:hypothetical protein
LTPVEQTADVKKAARLGDLSPDCFKYGEIIMKRLAASLLAIGLVGAGHPGFSVTPEDNSLLPEARALVKRYAGKLKHALKTAIQKEGTAQAVEACHLKAPDIADSLAGQSPWTLRRTSLKLRNLEDAPDRWETRVLESFEQRKAAGEDPAGIEFSEVINDGKTRVFRYMKAIPTVKLCTRCHGDDIDKSVAKQLESLYPFDQATGFHPGDIRGAFSLSRKLP